MDNITVNINDYEIIKTDTINNIKISTAHIELFKSITVRVGLYKDNTLVDNRMIYISGTDYANWGNDDNYIVDFVLTNLNLTKK